MRLRQYFNWCLNFDGTLVANSHVLDLSLKWADIPCPTWGPIHVAGGPERVRHTNVSLESIWDPWTVTGGPTGAVDSPYIHASLILNYSCIVKVIESSRKKGISKLFLHLCWKIATVKFISYLPPINKQEYIIYIYIYIHKYICSMYVCIV